MQVPEVKIETEVDGDTFRMWFLAPKQLLLHEEFEAMVWNECLRQAHGAGHMPVGSILITTEDATPKAQGPLGEGETLRDRMEHWQATQGAAHVAAGMGLAPVPVDMMKVTAEVMLGLSLS